MLQLLLVSSGGALGAVVRYSIGNLSKIYFVNSFYATLSINIIGSFLIGYLISLGYVKNISENFIKYFLIIGFLGSFTTFSAFSYEAVDLFLSKKMFLSLVYVIFSISFCIIAAYMGIYINKV
ncbi:MAG: fluoride efflux transporter FluC [Alphaproteobacteria bacterium]